MASPEDFRTPLLRNIGGGGDTRSSPQLILSLLSTALRGGGTRSHRKSQPVCREELTALPLLLFYLKAGQNQAEKELVGGQCWPCPRQLSVLERPSVVAASAGRH